jgi:hypothetical protein
MLLKFSLIFFHLKLDTMEGEVKGGTVWTASQSTFVQTFLANLVADGSKTSSGFKRVHLNACAKALNDHFKINRTHEQISNHLKILKKKYIKINQLRSKSGAVWDEENFIIHYDHETYASHFKVITLLYLYIFFCHYCCPVDINYLVQC